MRKPQRNALFIGGGLAVLITCAGLGRGAATAAAQPATAAAQPAAGAPGTVQRFPLTDPTALVSPETTMEAVEYKGRQAVRLTRTTPGPAYARLAGVEFQDGTIEADVAVKVPAPPPGGRMPGFIGVGFRARPDASRYELFYVRPGNARSDDQSMRNHATQYTSEPEFGWYALRRAWPWIYESYADLQPETWTPIKIVVKGRTASLFVHGAEQPTLVVDGLKGSDLRGGVMLSGYPGQESYFSNVRVTHAAPQPVKQGGEAAGAWQVTCSTDAGRYEGTLTLRRDGTTLTGTWSGALGKDKAVTGTWRDGYVELAFTGEWPKEMPMGKPGAADVTLAGWIDDAAAGGRMRIDDRADGRWTAKRTS